MVNSELELKINLGIEALEEAQKSSRKDHPRYEEAILALNEVKVRIALILSLLEEDEIEDDSDDVVGPISKL